MGGCGRGLLCCGLGHEAELSPDIRGDVSVFLTAAQVATAGGAGVAGFAFGISLSRLWQPTLPVQSAGGSFAELLLSSAAGAGFEGFRAKFSYLAGSRLDKLDMLD